MNYVTVKSYNGKLVRVPLERKEEYIENQNKINLYLREGKTIEEIRELLKNG